MVLVHEGLAHARQWDDQVETYAAGYTVVGYDQPGYGRSDPAAEAYSSSEDLAALLSHLGIRGAAIVGMSQGAGIALTDGLDHPDLARAFVLVAPGFLGFDGGPPRRRPSGTVSRRPGAATTGRRCARW